LGRDRAAPRRRRRHPRRRVRPGPRALGPDPSHRARAAERRAGGRREPARSAREAASMSAGHDKLFAPTALAGEVALVTGASRGMGRATLEALAAAGATVVGTATTPGGADAIGARLVELGAAGSGLVLDVRDRAACDATVDAVVKAHGQVAILVNNAGITRD